MLRSFLLVSLLLVSPAYGSPELSESTSEFLESGDKLGNTYLCAQGSGANSAIYNARYNYCNSQSGCGTICYPYHAFVDGNLWTNGYYKITCRCVTAPK